MAEAANDSQSLYTPDMLASVLNVAPSQVRGWYRRGLIRPVRILNRVPYFDFVQLVAGRHVERLVSEGLSPTAIHKALERVRRWLPDAGPGDLSIDSEGRELVVRRGGRVLGPEGQMHLDFSKDSDAFALSPESENAPIPITSRVITAQPDVLPGTEDFESRRLRRLAEKRESDGEPAQAIEAWRMVSFLEGPSSDLCYRLGELLYLAGDVSGARERYFMALELDPSRIDVRGSLGCLLLELNETELAIATLEGALSDDLRFPDVHFHLATALEMAERSDEAAEHWRAFLQLAPASPWTEHARAQLQRHDSDTR